MRYSLRQAIQLQLSQPSSLRLPPMIIFPPGPSLNHFVTPHPLLSPKQFVAGPLACLPPLSTTEN